MLKRIMFFIFGIDGLIEIETVSELKIVIIRWRIFRKNVNEMNPTFPDNLVPDGWKTIFITERW